MAKVSKYSLPDEVVKRFIGQLWDGLTLLEDRSQVRRFLSRFLTPTEIIMLAKRLELLKLAESDLEVEELKNLTGLVKSTIYYWLERHDGYEEDFHIVIDRLKKIDRERIEKASQNKESLPKLKYKLDTVPKSIQYLSRRLEKGYKKRKKRKAVLKGQSTNT